MHDQEFSNSICPQRTRIERHPHFVFLCGGAILNEELVNSARAAFLRHRDLLTTSPIWDKLILAEDIFNKFPEAEYKDLLSFEKDLAQLSSLIVIFLESAGSFAELGSFVAMPDVRRKVAVVIADKHARNKSFVWMGPITYLETNESDIEHRIYTYPWNPDAEPSAPETFFEDAESLVGQLEECLKRFKTTASLDIKNELHQMLLMIQFLNVSRIATATEVAEFLKSLGANEEVCRLEKIKGRLALLVCLELISEKPYGHNHFFIGLNEIRWINFGYKNDSQIRDERRWAASFSEIRQLQENKQKYLALKSWMKSHEKKDEPQLA